MAHWGWVPGDAGGWQPGWVYYSAGSGPGGSGGKGKAKAKAPSIQDYCRSHAHTCGNANQPVGGGGGSSEVGSAGDEGMCTGTNGHLRPTTCAGITFDMAALGLNAAYAGVTDIATYVWPPLYSPMLQGYMVYSILPNLVSTVGGVVWFIDGTISGENSFRVSGGPGAVQITASVSQDTVVALATNIAGWMIKEPNIASIVDAGVVGYDWGRVSGDPSWPDTLIPTWINLTLTYSSAHGLRIPLRRP